MQPPMSVLRLEVALEDKLISFIKALQHDKSNNSIVQLSPSVDGLKLSSESLKTVQSHLYLPKAIFTHWQWSSGETPGAGEPEDRPCSRVNFPLTQFIRSLDVCKSSSGGPHKRKLPKKEGNNGTASSGNGRTSLLVIEWTGGSDRASLRATDQADQVQIECQLATLVGAPSILTAPFVTADNPLTLRLITSASFLRSCLQRFADQTFLTLEYEPEAKIITLSSKHNDPLENTKNRHPYSIQATIAVDNEQLTSFVCSVPVRHTYPAPLFLPSSLTSLSLSSKVSLRINSHGSMSIQLMAPLATDSIFVEYIVASFSGS